MPFGIKSAAEVYQSEMTVIFQNIEGREVIVDDIIIWGEDKAQDDRRLKQVLDRVREKNLKLNPDKCEFRKTCISYCGHGLSENGLGADPEKVRAVKGCLFGVCLFRFVGFLFLLGSGKGCGL